jgi:ParB-like chromosome segregation protein Spo0J
MKEVICGYVVHPAAAVFPLMEGDAFDELVESVCRNGVQQPIVVRRGIDADELIDGRNRLRAAEEAQRAGFNVSVPVTEWADDGRSVAEWVWDTNAVRRQMNVDALNLAAAAISPLIEAENAARKKAAQFDAEKASKAAKARHAVNTKSCSPQNRDATEMHARSTAGQVAAKAGGSIHKARQAIAVRKAVDNGTLPPETIDDVMAGRKKLRDVAPKQETKPKPAAEPKRRSMAVILGDMRDLIAEWRDADHNLEVLRDELSTQLERL